MSPLVALSLGSGQRTPGPVPLTRMRNWAMGPCQPAVGAPSWDPRLSYTHGAQSASVLLRSLPRAPDRLHSGFLYRPQGRGCNKGTWCRWNRTHAGRGVLRCVPEDSSRVVGSQEKGVVVEREGGRVPCLPHWPHSQPAFELGHGGVLLKRRGQNIFCLTVC